MGLRRLSMSPAFVPTIKELVRRTTARQGPGIAAEVLRMKTSDEILDYLTRETCEVWPEVTLLDTRDQAGVAGEPG